MAHSLLSYQLTVAGLLGCFEEALHDRRQGVYRLERTHFSPCATAAVLSVVTAFEAFVVNEAFANSATWLPWAREYATSERTTTLDRCRGFFRVNSTATGAFDGVELGALLNVRNEIVHYLPRPTSTLLLPLERRGLLMSTPRASNWDVAQKLASYALA